MSLTNDIRNLPKDGSVDRREVLKLIDKIQEKIDAIKPKPPYPRQEKRSASRYCYGPEAI